MSGWRNNVFINLADPTYHLIILGFCMIVGGNLKYGINSDSTFDWLRGVTESSGRSETLFLEVS